MGGGFVARGVHADRLLACERLLGGAIAAALHGRERVLRASRARRRFFARCLPRCPRASRHIPSRRMMAASTIPNGLTWAQDPRDGPLPLLLFILTVVTGLVDAV